MQPIVWTIPKLFLSAIVSVWPILLLALLLGIAFAVLQGFFGKKVSKYLYQSRLSVMTSSELAFFKILLDLDVIKGQYHVFPQIHLDAILNHKVKGQSWTGAFRHMNQKSFDFVVCDIFNARPLLAIELDDRSHERENRRIRDREVERILQNAGFPLLRIGVANNYDLHGLSEKIRNFLTTNPKRIN